MPEMLAEARSGGYAVCYCESWNLESLQAVVEAAEEMGSPIIAGFNGGFLRHSSRRRPERLAYYGALAAGLEQSPVPISFILNETDHLEQIAEGIEAGFNAVMVENDSLDREQYEQLVKHVVRMAHARGVSVEGQVGHLAHGSDGSNGCGEVTDPGRAKAFVERTGVDALGVSIGNVHILTRGRAVIDIPSLSRIRDAVDIPLVVHGGTGFPPESASEVIGLGVAKFNFGTNLKQTYLATIREKLAGYAEPMNPHRFVGMGGEQDILVAAREAVKQRVKELIQTYGFARGRSAAPRSAVG
jgi:ketose-bisphosphate aldolase